VWAEAAREAEREVARAQTRIAERCRELGIQKDFAPSLSLTWRHRGYGNAVKERREELRRAAKAQIEWRRRSVKQVDLPAWARELIAEDRRREREMITAIREGIRDADPERFTVGIELAEQHVAHGWRQIMLAIRRCPPPTAAFRRWFRDEVWLRNGDHLRDKTNDDALLADALRVLMPLTGAVLRGSGEARRRGTGGGEPTACHGRAT
jgi:hypothetical protein